MEYILKLQKDLPFIKIKDIDKKANKFSYTINNNTFIMCLIGINSFNEEIYKVIKRSIKLTIKGKKSNGNKVLL